VRIEGYDVDRARGIAHLDAALGLEVDAGNARGENHLRSRRRGGPTRQPAPPRLKANPPNSAGSGPPRGRSAPGARPRRPRGGDGLRATALVQPARRIAVCSSDSLRSELLIGVRRSVEDAVQDGTEDPDLSRAPVEALEQVVLKCFGLTRSKVPRSQVQHIPEVRKFVNMFTDAATSLGLPWTNERRTGAPATQGSLSSCSRSGRAARAVSGRLRRPKDLARQRQDIGASFDSGRAILAGCKFEAPTDFDGRAPKSSAQDIG